MNFLKGIFINNITKRKGRPDFESLGDNHKVVQSENYYKRFTFYMLTYKQTYLFEKYVFFLYSISTL